MGLHEEEQAALAELKGLSEEEPTELKPVDEFLEEIQPQDDNIIEENGDADRQIQSTEEDQEEVSQEDQELERLEANEEDEEELTGAKLRHKQKAERIEKETAQLRERIAHLEGKAEGAAPQQPEVVGEVIPDKEYEPERHAVWKADKLEKKLEAMEVQQSRVNAERQWDQMQSNHSKSNPDYDTAKDYLLKSEAADIKKNHPTATESQISEYLKKQEYITAGKAAQMGHDPFQYIQYLAYEAGYRPGTETKIKENPQLKPNIKNIKRNAKKSASLIGGSAAGESGDAQSAEQLSRMGLDEITKMGKGNFEKAIRKLEARS